MRNPLTTLHKDTRLALALIALSAGMVGLSYASVPLYRLFCQVTGYGGTTQVATSAPTRILERTMTVRFDSNVAPDLNWSFEPVERNQTLRVGELGLAYYRVRNRGLERSTGMATFNVVPMAGGSYFSKVQCFCFIEQTLEPGEEKLMPVTYFIDPSIADDEGMDRVKSMTLSYTFFRRDEAESASGGT